MRNNLFDCGLFDALGINMIFLQGKLLVHFLYISNELILGTLWHRRLEGKTDNKKI